MDFLSERSEKAGSSPQGHSGVAKWYNLDARGCFDDDGGKKKGR